MNRLSESGLLSNLWASQILSNTVFVAVGRVKTVTKRINSTTLKLAKRINPALKVTGVKALTYEELVEATDNFIEENQIGQGGYGTVYKGRLHDGKQVAVKRAEPGSVQGAREFYNEIELLSRVHHKNVVMLEGYCDEEDHQVGNLP